MPDDSTEPLGDLEVGARNEDKMTEAEKLEIQKEAINLRMSELAAQRVKDSLRASFAALQDETLPVDKIVLQVLRTKRRITDDILDGFTDCLATAIRQYKESSTKESQ